MAKKKRGYALAAIAGAVVGGGVVWGLFSYGVLKPFAVVVPQSTPIVVTAPQPVAAPQMLTVPLGGPSSVTVQVPRSMF